jgi:hypothetical protein
MDCYDEFHNYFGDLHNHCGITFGLGSIEDAIRNAKQRLDFCSVTGHAFWTDMPEPNERIRHIIRFHQEGFEKLKSTWPHALEVFAQENQEGRFVTFPSFEIHSSQDGDRTILYRDDGGGLFYGDSIADVERKAEELRRAGQELIVFPHHISYQRGRRGLNWDAFNPSLAPVVEIISLHGCSENDDSPRPTLTPMGPSDGRSTMAYGLASGHFFGVIGGTDHHAGHPGSYGSGLTGVWARELSRKGIWEALLSRRTYAMTGDKVKLEVSINGYPMGSVIPPTREREIAIRVHAGDAIDYVDIVKNNGLLKRFSQYEIEDRAADSQMRTKLFLEVGWGHRNRQTDWEIDFGLSGGRILQIEPRFRGHLVQSPLDRNGGPLQTFFSSWNQIDEKAVHFRTVTSGNPNPYTNTCQGICLEAETSPQAGVVLHVNRQKVVVPVRRLLEGAVTGTISEEIESEAWRLHRAPLRHEYEWEAEYRDSDTTDLPGSGPNAGVEQPQEREADIYYVRIRQKNDQWAFSSPLKVLHRQRRRERGTHE